MPLPLVLGRLVDRRLSALRRHLPAALEGDVTGVHQARVATRRLREALPVAGVSAPGKDVTRALRRVRRLTRALGPVRELDVALGLLAHLEGARPELAGATELTRVAVAEVREDRRRALVGEVKREDVARVARRIAQLSRDASALDDSWRSVLSRRAERRACSLQEAIEAAGTLYSAERLHAVRIAAKQLRYALELVAETRSAACARAVAELKRMQDVLGELHDLQILAHYVSVARLRSPAGGEEAAPLAELITHIEDECRRLHAVFLGRRARLAAAAADARERVVPALRTTARRPARRMRPNA